jgi:hypothetical protein
LNLIFRNELNKAQIHPQTPSPTQFNSHFHIPRFPKHTTMPHSAQTSPLIARITTIPSPNPLLILTLPQILLIEPTIANLPECRGTRGSVRVEVLVEPRADDAALGAQTADLDAVAAPAFFAAVWVVSWCWCGCWGTGG